jgi:hypothetical protein
MMQTEKAEGRTDNVLGPWADNVNELGYDAPEVKQDAKLEDLPKEVPDPDIAQFPPFNIPNRTRAERVVDKLYGVGARLRFPKKTNAGSVQVVLQEGDKCTVLRQAASINELLSEPVESYVRGGRDLEDTVRRIRSLE